MAVKIGQDVGNYHIVEELGQGGMATVYKAYDTRLERQVAIKFIRAGAIGSDQLEETLKRFEREARALAMFLHPNIVPVYGYGEYEGAPYLVMAYLPGGSLKALTGKPMPYAEAARLLAPVARALEYAHGKKVIHRDVKPGNILITSKGVPMLSDFGIAKILSGDEKSKLTGTGVGIGTPEYMAPEQWEGNAVPQTDIYALGVVFFELVTGHKPYTADTPAAVLIKQISEPLPRPGSFVPGLPNEVEQVLFMALAKEAGNRYATMAEFAGALERLGNLISPSSPLPSGEGSQAPFPALGGRVGDGGTPSLTVDQLAVPQPAAQQTAAQHSRRYVGMYAAWSGIGIALLCLLGVLGAAIATRGFGLLKAQPTGTAQVTGQNGTTPPAQNGTSAPITNPGIGTTMVSDKDGMVQVYVPAGEFMMGAANSDKDAQSNEKPQHKVYLDAFWIDRIPVTNGMYARCVAAGKCQKPDATYSATHDSYYGFPQYIDYPVVWVDWSMANTYCAWAGRRLPTEAEWEKAARGTDGRIYPWGNQSPDCKKANYAGKGGDTPCVGDTTKVGSYPDGASPYGVLDMAGNVWEWVNDLYSETYYQNSPQRNPTGPDSGQEYVLRGGSWSDVSKNLRASYRLGNLGSNKSYNYVDLGFRCTH